MQLSDFSTDQSKCTFWKSGGKIVFQCAFKVSLAIEWTSIRCHAAPHIFLYSLLCIIEKETSSFSRVRLYWIYLVRKRSSGWLESWEGLLFATDVLTTCAEAIWIMRTIGGLGRDIGRYIDRYIGRLSVDYWPTIGGNMGYFPLCQTDRSVITRTTQGKWNDIFRLNRANQ